NLYLVLLGKRTWVSYSAALSDPRIPRLRPGVLGLSGGDGVKPDRRIVRRMDLEYAKDYRVWKDVERVMTDFSQLGRA
ncbi:MAG: hypothetical protein ABIQ75_07020, partial [Flavobacteriales bacterium]